MIEREKLSAKNWILLVALVFAAAFMAGCSVRAGGDLYYPAPKDPAMSRAATLNSWHELGGQK